MSSSTNAGQTLKRANPSTIQDKFLVGYQGWFTCPGDGPPLDPNHHGWLHWFNYPIPDGGRPNTDIWPDVSEYSPSELFAAPGLKYADGEQAFLFSSRNARTVERHFHWMALHGVDGAFLQRFLGQCDIEQGNEAIRSQRDEVGELVRKAAEKEGRVYAIMYDISGVAPDRIQRVIERDWIHLLRSQRVLDSPNYLKEKGKAVVTLWGFGMSDQNHDPATVRAVTDFIRNNTPGGAYIMGGGPAHWRTSTSDADRNPEFVNVWLECFDAISPWTVGRYGDPNGADSFAEHNVKGDLELIRKRNEEAERGVPGRRHIDYIPVILPGGSGFNLSEGKWEWNGIKRLGGRFLWRQLWNLKRQGVRTIYGAMWDEYDEGTAFMPVVSKKRQVPKHDKYEFMALDEDGYDLPPDWYMRIAGFIAEGLRSERIIHETFPSKELDDYWSTRPRYEEKEDHGASGSGQEKSQSWEEWQKWENEKGQEEPPPPPYSMEQDEQRQAPPLPPKGEIVLSPPTTSVQPATGLQHNDVSLATHTAAVLTTLVTPAASSPPPVAPRPEYVAGAVGAIGALNAHPNRSPEKPPIPLASRPSVSRPSGTLGDIGSSNGPPPIPSRRPQTTSVSYGPATSQSSGSSSSYFNAPPNTATTSNVSALAEDFSRQSSISSAHSPTSPRFDVPPQHPARPSSSRPTSPPSIARPSSALNRPPSVGNRPPSSCANPPFPGYTPAPYRQSHTPPGEPQHTLYVGHSTTTYEPHAPYNEPHSPTTSFPVPGFAPSGNPPSGSASGPWSQAPWPPSEWGAPAPPSPTTNVPYATYQSHRPQSQTPGYGYGPSYASSNSPPPLAPRPSHRPASPTQQPTSSYAPLNSGPGGFSFPQAQTSYPQSSYAPPPQPHQAPQPYGAYGDNSASLGFPTGPTAQSYAPYPSASPYPEPGPYGGYASGSSSYANSPGSSLTGGMPPPPQRPQSGASWSHYPAGNAGRPQQGSGPLGSFLGRGGGITGLAQTGLATGEKLFNKLRK